MDFHRFANLDVPARALSFVLVVGQGSIVEAHRQCIGPARDPASMSWWRQISPQRMLGRS
jgi:hypothetical protein